MLLQTCYRFQAEIYIGVSVMHMSTAIVGDLPQDLSVSRDAVDHLNHLTLEVTLNLKRKLHKVNFNTCLSSKHAITAREVI